MTAKSKKTDWLDRTLVCSPCYLTLCTRKKQLRKIENELKIKKKDRKPFLKTRFAHATAHYYENGNDKSLCAVICIKPEKERSTEEIYGLLVHEATHVWQWVREVIDEKDPSPEFEAYALQAIAQRLMEEYRRQTS